MNGLSDDEDDLEEGEKDGQGALSASIRLEVARKRPMHQTLMKGMGRGRYTTQKKKLRPAVKHELFFLLVLLLFLLFPCFFLFTLSSFSMSRSLPILPQILYFCPRSAPHLIISVLDVFLHLFSSTLGAKRLSTA